MTKSEDEKKDRIIAALDVDDLILAEKLVEQLKDIIKIFKVGSQLFTAAGPESIKMVTDKGGQVFLDLKFHDIPNTVAQAAQAATEQKVFMFNVHASGGSEMMRSAVRASHQKALQTGEQRPIILGVTVLTSSDEKELKELGINRTVKDQVVYLTELARESRLDGVVCSAQEIELIRPTAGQGFVIVTPGIRPAWSETNDQKRIMTPAQAFEKGADYIVVGRPITAASDPAAAARRIIDELE